MHNSKCIFPLLLITIPITLLTTMTVHPLYPAFATPISSFVMDKQSITFPNDQSTNSITITISDDAIYSHVKASLDGQDWVQHTIPTNAQCTFHPDDPSHNWLTGTCTLTIPMPASGFPSLAPGTTATRNYITAYSCDEILFPILGFRLGWDCHGSTETPQMWQIWRFDASLEEATPPPPPSWQDGIVSWWGFEDNADDELGDNDGIVNGATSTSTDCVYGSCYSFDGVDDYIDFGNDASLNIVDDITISFWIRPDSLDGTPIPFSRGAYHSNGWYTMLRSSGYISTRLCTPGTDNDLNSNPGLSTGEWTHVVIVISNGNSYDYYFDGTLNKHSTTSVTYSGSASQNFYVGAYNADGDDPFDGLIDEVMIWNRSLAESEVADVYNYFTSTCETDGECPPDGTEYYCSGTEVVRGVTDWQCIDGVCTDSVSTQVVEDCADTDMVCQGGECVSQPSCDPHSYTQCYDGDVYYYDSCGNREEIYDDCSSDESCAGGQCISQGILYQNDFEHRPLGNYSSRSEFDSDWNIHDTSAFNRWDEFEIVYDPAGGTNKVGMFTYPFYDSDDFYWVCYCSACYEGEHLIHFSSEPTFCQSREQNNGVGPASGGGQWHIDLDGSHDSVYLSYKVRFGTNFYPVDGGKLPGMRGGENCGACVPTDCDGDGIADEFSTRMMFQREPNEPIFYVYHYDKVHTCGDGSGISGGEVIMDGEWHEILYHVQMNTVDDYNGYIEAWIDGNYASYWGGLRFKVGADAFAIDQISFTSFFGGDDDLRCTDYQVSTGAYGCSTYSDGTNYFFYAPRKTEHLYVDDIVVYT